MNSNLHLKDSWSAELLDEVTLEAQSFLNAFANDEAFSTNITLAFGSLIGAEILEGLRQQWSLGNFNDLPRIEIRSSSEINGANGAFVSATNTIYLSKEFISRNASNPGVITNVLLEEIGHFVDARVNLLDAAGDEGAIFSALVRGETLKEQQLQLLRSEDDSATITLDGQTLAIEQAVGQPYYVNALLYPGEPRWGSGSPVGSPVTVSYSFLSQVPDYYTSTAEERTGFQTIDQYQPNGTLRTAIGRALDYWSSIANISFTPVTGLGSITFGAASMVNKSAHAYPPNSGRGGDVWLNTNETSNLTQTPGSFGFATLLHEIGHALGLKHPGNYNAGGGSAPPPYLPLAEDNNTNTIMTYNDVGSNVASPMLYDVAALQYLYGARSYNPTSTTYSFNSVHSYTVNGSSQVFGSTTTPTKLTIWDSGGTKDTLDFSALSSNASGYQFDLYQGEINTTQTAYNASPYTAYNDTSGTKYRTSSFGTVIAFNTVIEDLIGSSSNDTIHGNDATNVLRGGSGDDTMTGAVGNDIVYGDSGNDSLIGVLGDDILYGGLDNDIYLVDSSADIITEFLNEGRDTVMTYSNFTLGDNLENLTLSIGTTATSGTGNSLNNVITGNDVNNTLYGQGGNDILSGGFGNDILQGGDGNNYLYGEFGDDFFIGGNQTDYIDGGQGNDSIYAVGGDDILFGNSGIDKLHGGEGNDILDGGTENDYLFGGSETVTLSNTGNDDLNGGAGNDVMNGQDGNDSYTVDSTGDVIIEDSSTGGTDTVYSTINWTLGTNLENLKLKGTGAINGEGNELNNVITGNDAANVLTGNYSNDTLYGGQGNDLMLGGDGRDAIYGGSSPSSISTSGNDTLNGGTGADNMYGGDGNDLYIVDDLGDFVDEDSITGGIDTVDSSVSFLMEGIVFDDGIENLNLTGSSAIDGTGNTLNNSINGNNANNLLEGRGGVDRISGNFGDDTIRGEDGNDSYLAGGPDNDFIYGGTGDDFLTGATDIDYLEGGSGNDTYEVWGNISGSDIATVVEFANQGIDTVKSYTSFTLANNIENLELIEFGSTDVYSAKGNSLANKISGNGANNSLDGGSGNDTLIGGGGIDTLIGGTGNDSIAGGAGADRLTGNAGKDRFVFKSKAEGRDTITDFAVVDDTIDVSKAGFGGGLTAGAAITAAQFRLGTRAGDASDRFIYNRTTGALLFDSDGTGAIASIQFAQLSTGLALTNNDIFVTA